MKANMPQLLRNIISLLFVLISVFIDLLHADEIGRNDLRNYSPYLYFFSKNDISNTFINDTLLFYNFYRKGNFSNIRPRNTRIDSILEYPAVVTKVNSNTSKHGANTICLDLVSLKKKYKCTFCFDRDSSYNERILRKSQFRKYMNESIGQYYEPDIINNKSELSILGLNYNSIKDYWKVVEISFYDAIDPFTRSKHEYSSLVTESWMNKYWFEYKFVNEQGLSFINAMPEYSSSPFFLNHDDRSLANCKKLRNYYSDSLWCLSKLSDEYKDQPTIDKNGIINGFEPIAESVFVIKYPFYRSKEVLSKSKLLKYINVSDPDIADDYNIDEVATNIIMKAKEYDMFVRYEYGLEMGASSQSDYFFYQGRFLFVQ